MTYYNISRGTKVDRDLAEKMDEFGRTMRQSPSYTMRMLLEMGYVLAKNLQSEEFRELLDTAPLLDKLSPTTREEVIKLAEKELPTNWAGFIRKRYEKKQEQDNPGWRGLFLKQPIQFYRWSAADFGNIPLDKLEGIHNVLQSNLMTIEQVLAEQKAFEGQRVASKNQAKQETSSTLQEAGISTMTQDATSSNIEVGEMQELNTELQSGDRYDLIELRRAKVIQLLSKGFNQRCIEIPCYYGFPKYDITEVVNPAGVEEYQALISEAHLIPNLTALHFLH